MKAAGLFALLVAALLSGPVTAAPALKAPIASLAELPTPLPYPYDEHADAKAQVAAAAKRAKASGKRLFIDLGGNWCGDCRILASLIELPGIKGFMDHHYEVVSVDVGRMDKNLDIPATYGVTGLEGVPSVLIIDRKGRLLDRGHEAALKDARHMTPQGIADWLAGWTG